MNTYLPSLITLFFSIGALAQDCRPSLYKYQDKALCFSLKQKAYLTETCGAGKCEALNYVDKAKALNLSKLPAKEDGLPGSIACGAVGGKAEIITSDKTGDKLCLCVAPDFSGVSCSKLGLR